MRPAERDLIARHVLNKLEGQREEDYKAIREYINEKVESLDLDGIVRNMPRTLTNSGGPRTRLEEMVDVNVSNLTNNQILKYNIITGRWENKPDEEGSAALWGSITGTLSDQTDLQAALDAKYPTASFNTDFDNRFGLKTTTDLAEGTNLYYTDARFDTRLGTKSTTDLSEGTNLYYTEARVSANTDVAANTAKVGVTDEISNVVEDTTPQLGGALDCQNNNITNGGKAEFSSTDSTYALQLETTANGNNNEILDLYQNGSTPADFDEMNVNFYFNNSAAEKTSFAKLEVFADDVTDGTEDGSVSLRTLVGGAITSLFGSFEDKLTVYRLGYDTAEGKVSSLGNLGTTEAIDWATATHFEGTLNDNVTITHSNERTGQKITLALAYDGTAQRTITWSDVDKWSGGSAPTAPSAAGEVLVVTLLFLGTTCYGSGEIFS